MSHSMLMLVLAGLAASGTLLAGLTIIILRETRRTIAIDRRLSAPRRQALAAGLWAERRERRGGGGDSARALGVQLVKAGSMLAPVGAAEREKLAQMLRQAGFAQRDALSIYLSVKLVVALAFAAGAGLAASASEMVGEHGAAVAMAGAVGLVIGGIVPEYGLRGLVARRARRMSAALPDALDLMVMCLESGLTFERGLDTVARELVPIEPNLAAEFRLLETELRVASDRRAVLQEYYRRTEIDGLRDLAMTLVQSDRFGTPLTQSMKNIAAGERTQRGMRIMEQAERLPVLMTLPMLLFVVPGTMLLVAGPAILTALGALSSIGGG